MRAFPGDTQDEPVSLSVLSIGVLSVFLLLQQIWRERAGLRLGTEKWTSDVFLHCDRSSLHGMKCQGMLLPPATPPAGGGKKPGTFTSAGADGCVLVSLEEKNRRRSRCHLGLVERRTVA